MELMQELATEKETVTFGIEARKRRLRTGVWSAAPIQLSVVCGFGAMQRCRRGKRRKPRRRPSFRRPHDASRCLAELSPASIRRSRAPRRNGIGYSFEIALMLPPRASIAGTAICPDCLRRCAGGRARSPGASFSRRSSSRVRSVAFSFIRSLRSALPSARVSCERFHVVMVRVELAYHGFQNDERARQQKKTRRMWTPFRLPARSSASNASPIETSASLLR